MWVKKEKDINASLKNCIKGEFLLTIVKGNNTIKMY